MLYPLASAFLLAVAYPMIGTGAAIWALLGSQFALLAGQIKTKQVSGVGGFIFMYCLFFGMRPLYLYLENDTAHFANFFLIRVNTQIIGSAMWWSTLALFCFVLGAKFTLSAHRRWILGRAVRSRRQSVATHVNMAMCAWALGLQVLTLPLMIYIASLRRNVYGSEAGAYLYDLPVPLQAVHIFAVVIIAGRYWKTRTMQAGAALAASVFLLLLFTWFMREVTNFRGFYLSGVIVAGLAVLHQMRPRVGYAWLIIPIVVAQPLFAYLGVERRKSNEELAEAAIEERVILNDGLLASYWHFYQGGRDMNIFDTFVAAKQSQPRWYPYAWSWAYVPLHWIPRPLWKGKPPRGLTQDMSFTRLAPLSPGISGFFLLDGGLWWMLGSMFVLGYLLCLLDAYLVTLPRGYLRACLVSIAVVSAMFLSRLLLWQYFYQMLYMMAVVLVLAWVFHKMAPVLSSKRTVQRQRGQSGIAAPRPVLNASTRSLE